MSTIELFVTSCGASFGLGLIVAILWYETKVVPVYRRVENRYRQKNITAEAAMDRMRRESREHRGTPYARLVVTESTVPVEFVTGREIVVDDEHNGSRRARALQVVK